ncbi:hypothetical protein BH10CYA1_BH10CYA1_60130 [soil metagenome]
MVDKIRVLIVEDDNLVRLGLKLVLNATAEMKIIGEAGSGLAAIEKTRELQPDVVLLDIGLPDMNGLEALPEIRQQCSTARIIVLTSHEDLSIPVMNAGADGLCRKNVSNDQLILAIRAVLSGEKWFDVPQLR